MWIHRTAACRKVGAVGPGSGPVRLQKYPSGWARLPAEVIFRVIAQNKHLIMQCYDSSALAGQCEDSRIWIRFAIGRDGRVSLSEAVKDKDGDPDLAKCVAGAVHQLTFPQPEGGIITVTMPVRFLR